MKVVIPMSGMSSRFTVAGYEIPKYLIEVDGKKLITKITEDLIKVLHGMPQRVKILGFYKNIPIFHDPKYPTSDGEMYFINEDNFIVKPNALKI